MLWFTAQAITWILQFMWSNIYSPQTFCKLFRIFTCWPRLKTWERLKTWNLNWEQDIKIYTFWQKFYLMRSSLLSWFFFKFLAFFWPVFIVSYLQIQQAKNRWTINISLNHFFAPLETKIWNIRDRDSQKRSSRLRPSLETPSLPSTHFCPTQCGSHFHCLSPREFFLAFKSYYFGSLGVSQCMKSFSEKKLGPSLLPSSATFVQQWFKSTAIHISTSSWTG